MTNPPPPRAPGGIAALGGRSVARIGFGAMQLAERPGRAATDRAAAVALLRRAVDLGVNHIDTAQFYGPGTCNELIRAALAPYPEELTLVTKVGATLRDSAIVPAQRPEELRAQVEANLATLGVEQVAVVNLRRLDAPPGLRAEGDQLVDLDSQLAELISLRDAGKIGAIGLSHVDADRLRRALPAGIVCVQNAYSLLDRAATPVLEVCRAHDIAWVPYFPLGSAFPGYPKVTDHPVVREIAARLDAAPAAVGLAWLLADYPHTLLIPGTSDPDHLAENMGAGAIRLAADDLAALTGIGA
ncbi:aldo/keto reductase [Nocardia terpenica]|uniref:Aldo/keto reductase n=1 Tax=Nocardia terpenica TaxID=455432 RepID=A0A291RCU2_9NOCA|nr:aldo/keto reductase [Nocardia terpenica]ATL65421.1 aldo/keto reductase [Nocardia terpenica]